MEISDLLKESVERRASRAPSSCFYPAKAGLSFPGADFSYWAYRKRKIHYSGLYDRVHQ